MKSRMNREIHVRIREGLGVRLPRATRLNLVQALLRNVGTFAPRGFARDEGRSLRAALQGEALNRLTLLGVERRQVVSG